MKMPTPHIIGMPKSSSRKKPERKVNIGQTYPKPPIDVEIAQKLDTMDEQQIFQAIAPRLCKVRDWNKRLSHIIEQIKEKEEEERLKAERDAEEQRKRIEHPCFKYLDTYFRAIHFNEKEGLLPYSQMNVKDLGTLLQQLKTYECYRKDFNDIKPQAISWLRNLRIDRQATENNPEKPEKRSFLGKVATTLKGH